MQTKKEPFATPEECKKHVVHLDSLAKFKMAPPAENRIVSGERITINFATVQPNSFFPVHRHEHEQIMMIMDGSSDWVVEGKLYHVEKGDVITFPSNVEHGGYILDKGLTVIDVFSPARQDMIAKQREAMGKKG